MNGGRILHAGTATGPVLRLDEPVSFWGGVDPETGTIIDRAHPQVGASMAGAVVVMPGSRGSSGTPGVLGEALRRGTGPAALIITKADVNLIAGTIVAAALYDVHCPIVQVDDDVLTSLASASTITVATVGELIVDDGTSESNPPAGV